MSLDRRNFLKFISLGCLTSTFALSSCTHRKFYNPDQNIILGGGRFKQNNELRHVLAVVNLQQDENQQVDLDFLAHGIIIDPKDKKRLLAFEKNGTAVAEVDLNTHRQTKKFKTTKDKYFCGHGVFDKTGDTLFCTETYQNNHKGIIAIRDGSSFEVLGEFPTYGENPHDCQLINDATILVITNAGSANVKDSQPSVTYVDVQSQKLIERITLTNQQLNTGHIGIADDGSLIVASAPREGLEEAHTGGVSIRSGKESMLSMTQPEVVTSQMTGEALSITIDNKRNIAVVTHPDANMVTFWSIDKKELLKAMSVPDPRGATLSLDEKSFIISYGLNTSIILVRTKDLSANIDSIIRPSYISGSHIYNWSKIIKEIMPTDIYT